MNAKSAFPFSSGLSWQDIFWASNPKKPPKGAERRKKGPRQLTGIALNRTKAKLLHELALQVQDDHFLGANLLRLLTDLVKVLLLTDVGAETDDFILLIEKPAQDATGIETACVHGWLSGKGQCGD